jgi:hypothetical protein
MTDETKTARTDSGKSGYRAAPAPAANLGRTTGGSGVQRSHLRDRKRWLKNRVRAGQTWAQRKAASTTYCPAKPAGRDRS